MGKVTVNLDRIDDGRDRVDYLLSIKVNEFSFGK